MLCLTYATRCPPSVNPDLYTTSDLLYPNVLMNDFAESPRETATSELVVGSDGAVVGVYV